MKRTAAGAADGSGGAPKRVARAPRAPRSRERDWRSTLFVWRGVLQLADGVVTWQGAWVGSDDGAEPSAAAFAASANTFTVRGSARDRTSLLQPDEMGNAPRLMGTDQDTLLGSFDFDFADSSYVLDVGDAPKTDDAHRFVVLAGGGAGGGAAEVGAFGRNEFGRFVSFGHVTACAPDARSAVLTLARRYVRDGDARAAVASADGLRQSMAARRAAGGGAAGALPDYAAMLPLRIE